MLQLFATFVYSFRQLDFRQKKRNGFKAYVSQSINF